MSLDCPFEVDEALQVEEALLLISLQGSRGGAQLKLRVEKINCLAFRSYLRCLRKESTRAITDLHSAESNGDATEKETYERSVAHAQQEGGVSSLLCLENDRGK